MNCPTDGTLANLLSAALAPDETNSVRTHLGQCTTCQKRLDQLTDAPSLARKPNSKAEIAVAGIDPLMARLKRMNDKPPTQLRPLDHDDEEESTSIWRSVALIAMAAVLLLAGAWAWDHYRLQKKHEAATAAMSLENTRARSVIDQLYANTIVVIDQKDAHATKRDTAVELLNYYQLQFNETKDDPSRMSEAAEIAFRLAMLYEIVGPDLAAADRFMTALQWTNALPANQRFDRERFCNEHMADLYAKSKQWGRAEMALRRQLHYLQAKVSVNPQDGKSRRDLVALLRRIADASERNSDFAGSVGSYQAAIEIVAAELQQSPDSPFVREELAELYEALGTTLKKTTQVQQTELAEQSLQKAKALREQK